LIARYWRITSRWSRSATCRWPTRPGVAAPCLAIEKDPSTAYDYTAKGNLVAVISNGTAVLGLGDLGALAGKPVMEGKAVLFKRFADVDCIDLEVDTKDVDEFINCVRYLGPTFGGINLEDIKAPECFIIEQRLRELMDIPSSTTTSTARRSSPRRPDQRAAPHRARHQGHQDRGERRRRGGDRLHRAREGMGMPHENAILCDTKGVIYQGPHRGHEPVEVERPRGPTKARTLAEAMKGADVFFGLSVKGAVTKDMVQSMAAKPIIFAMANPDPEITPEEVPQPAATRSSPPAARTTQPGQQRAGLPLHLPRRARRARHDHQRGDEGRRRRGAGRARARGRAGRGRPRLFRPPPALRPEYIIPVPFDPRLIVRSPAAVAKAAMDSGVAQKKIADMAEYKRSLSGRLDPTSHFLQSIFEQVKANPQRIVFAEGEEDPDVPRQRLRHADPDRPRGAGARDHEVARHHRRYGARNPQCAPVDQERALYRPRVQAAAA
jgi:malate dehydrogenase (oxaloacetate-decarboxylating)(NADP+)